MVPKYQKYQTVQQFCLAEITPKVTGDTINSTIKMSQRRLTQQNYLYRIATINLLKSREHVGAARYGILKCDMLTILTSHKAVYRPSEIMLHFAITNSCMAPVACAFWGLNNVYLLYLFPFYLQSGQSSSSCNKTILKH